MADQPKELQGVITCGGTPTAQDWLEIANFREFLPIRRQAKDHGLSVPDAVRYAATEVYGNELGE